MNNSEIVLLRHAREIAGVTQPVVARLLRHRVSEVSRWETGRVQPRPEIVARWRRGLLPILLHERHSLAERLRALDVATAQLVAADRIAAAPIAEDIAQVETVDR